MMMSLADFKRELKKTKHWEFRAHWTSGKTYRRTVQKVQSNAAVFDSLRNPKENSYLWWPKAKECIFLDGGVYIVEQALQDVFIENYNKLGPPKKTVDPYLFYKPMEQ